MSAGKKMLLSPEEVSEMIGFNTGTLANWRSQGKGPRYQKIGRMVKYHMSYVQEWLEGHPVIDTMQ